MELTGNLFFFNWEVQLITWLQTHLGTAGASAASFISVFGEELICIAVLGFLYWCYDKEFGKYVGINVLAANVFNPMIKNVFIRRRPYFDNSVIACLKPVDKSAGIYDIAAQGYSFPSGHSTNAVTVFGSLFMYTKNRWLAIVGIVIPLLVGISRFCLGVHYPTDVLAGWLLGLVIVLILPVLAGRFKKRSHFYILLLALSVPGVFYCRSSDYFTGVGLLTGYILAIPFEEKYVRFSNTRSPLRSVLRILGGLVIYFILNTVLKLPFSHEFLHSATMPSFLVRTLRYFIIAFIALGVYPLAFRYTDRFFRR